MPKSDPLVAQLRVDPGDAACLEARSPADRLGLGKKDDVAVAGLQQALAERLDELHNRLWAEAKRSVLLVLQGMDASGKDGTIRRVLSGLNPQGCDVVNFKEPTTQDLAHDYLWRIHQACPPRGILGVMNRSHYEDVVTARAIGVIDDHGRKRRYRHIREFERLLSDEGTTVVKVFLHISKEEQRARLQARIDDPAKNWKFRASDLDTRARWDEYHELYEAAISATSTDWAQWYVVPADHRWVRDVAVASILVGVFEAIDPRIPDCAPDLAGIVVE
jgi:PPK2 family polyphosphate:nucleotide phosphotransferase